MLSRPALTLRTAGCLVARPGCEPWLCEQFGKGTSPSWASAFPAPKWGQEQCFSNVPDAQKVLQAWQLAWMAGFRVITFVGSKDPPSSLGHTPGSVLGTGGPLERGAPCRS